jgi:hypothetical protein
LASSDRFSAFPGLLPFAPADPTPPAEFGPLLPLRRLALEVVRELAADADFLSLADWDSFAILD